MSVPLELVPVEVPPGEWSVAIEHHDPDIGFVARDDCTGYHPLR